MSRSSRDRVLPCSGGSDRWDRGPAGAILTTEFFWLEDLPPPLGSGEFAIWSGNGWATTPCRVWTGTDWVVKPIRFWSGSAWLLA